MNRLYVFGFILLIVPTFAIGQKTNLLPAKNKAETNPRRDLQEIERLEIEWNRINEVSDPEGKELLLADDSYHVGPSGRVYTKEQDIAAARATESQNRGSNSTLRFIITNKRIRLYKNIAVVTATGTSIRTRDGVERKGNYFRVVHVWEKRDGRWQLVVDQVTGVAN